MPAALTPRNSSSAQQLPSPLPMRPSGRMFCFTAPPRAPAGACEAPPPARPGAPGEQRSESFPLTQRPSGTLPARAKCGTLSSQRPRTPPAPGQILREHPTCVPRPSPVRNTSPTYPSGNARQAALRDVEPGSLAPPRGCPPSPCSPASPSRSRHAAPDLPPPAQSRGSTNSTRATQAAQIPPVTAQCRVHPDERAPEHGTQKPRPAGGQDGA